MSPLAREVRERSMPEGAGARLDAARAALSTLEGEERRLERLGFERPLAGCREEIRFWRLVAAVLALPRSGALDAVPMGGSPWPGVSR